jgi:hypothetical protein
LRGLSTAFSVEHLNAPLHVFSLHRA